MLFSGHFQIQDPSQEHLNIEILCISRVIYWSLKPRQIIRFYHWPACEEAVGTNEENWNTPDYLQQFNLCGDEILIASEL